jgi:hypothetical protein
MYREGREEVKKLRAQDKGQAEEMRVLCSVVMEGNRAPISLDDLANTSRATFRIRESLRAGQPVEV